jgi:hypothetical protein
MLPLAQEEAMSTSTNDFPVPDWIKQLKDAEKLKNAREAAREMEEKYAWEILSSHGGEFWQELHEKLFINLKALKTLKLTGGIQPGENDGGQLYFHIRISRSDTLRSVSIFANIFWIKGSNLIRVYVDNVPSRDLRICVVDGQLRVSDDGFNSEMNASDTARYIVQWLVGKIKQELLR